MEEARRVLARLERIETLQREHALPGDLLGRAQDSVGVAGAVAAQDPRLVTAFHDSFLAGMSTACTVVGLLCLAGAVGAAFLLPGRIRPDVELAETPSGALVPASS